MNNKQVPLIKMNGIGNKILVVDMRLQTSPFEQSAVLARAADKQTDFDQIMVIYSPRQADTDAFIEIWNQDGTQASACGNGMRCVVTYLASKQVSTFFENGSGQQFHFETPSGFAQSLYLGAGRVRVDMGPPAFGWRDIPTTRPLTDTLYVDMRVDALQKATLVSMGNPHCIFFVTEDVQEIALEYYGPILERDPLFSDKSNISLARLLSGQEMQLRTWERGAGLTQACGSAACAAVVASIRRGLSERQVNVHLPGGDLQIEWHAQTGHVLMTGDTEYEFSGLIDPVSGHFVKDG